MTLNLCLLVIFLLSLQEFLTNASLPLSFQAEHSRLVHLRRLQLPGVVVEADAAVVAPRSERGRSARGTGGLQLPPATAGTPEPGSAQRDRH